MKNGKSNKGGLSKGGREKDHSDPESCELWNEEGLGEKKEVSGGTLKGGPKICSAPFTKNKRRKCWYGRTKGKI